MELGRADGIIRRARAGKTSVERVLLPCGFSALNSGRATTKLREPGRDRSIVGGTELTQDVQDEIEGDVRVSG